MFSDGLCKQLVRKGFDLLMGVCLMQCFIQDMICCVLVDELLFGCFVDGGCLGVDVDDKDEVVLDILLNNKVNKLKVEFVMVS